MTATVEIRRARPSDLGCIGDALRALAAHLGDPYRVTEADIAQAAFGAVPSVCAEIALDGDGTCVGLLMASPVFSTIQGGPGLFVNDLWVDPAARGKGTARQLLVAACRDAASLWGEIRFLRLMAHDHNAAGREVYDRLGFRGMDGMGILILEGAALQQLEKRA